MNSIESCPQHLRTLYAHWPRTVRRQIICTRTTTIVFQLICKTAYNVGRTRRLRLQSAKTLILFNVPVACLQNLRGWYMVEGKSWGFAVQCFVWCALCRLCRNRNGKDMRLIILGKNKEYAISIIEVEKNRHWLNIWASRLLWLRQEFLPQSLYLSFGFWGQFSATKSRSHFSSSWQSSWILSHPLYLSREEGCFRADLHRWTSAASTSFSRILAGHFFLLQIHTLHAFQLQLLLTDWTSQADVDIKNWEL